MNPVVTRQTAPKEQFMVRTECELLDWYRKQALDSDRSITYVINHALKEYRKAQEARREQQA